MHSYKRIAGVWVKQRDREGEREYSRARRREKWWARERTDRALKMCAHSMYTSNTLHCAAGKLVHSVGWFIFIVHAAVYFYSLLLSSWFSFSYICVSAYIFDWIRDRKSHRHNRHEVHWEWNRKDPPINKWRQTKPENELAKSERNNIENWVDDHGIPTKSQLRSEFIQFILRPFGYCVAWDWRFAFHLISALAKVTSQHGSFSISSSYFESTDVRHAVTVFAFFFSPTHRVRALFTDVFLLVNRISGLHVCVFVRFLCCVWCRFDVGNHKPYI